MNEQTDRSAASLYNLADPRLATVDRWVFLVDPDELRARSHYLRLKWTDASFRRRRWRLPRCGEIVAYGELRDDALSKAPGTFLRPVLWLRTSIDPAKVIDKTGAPKLVRDSDGIWHQAGNRPGYFAGLSSEASSTLPSVLVAAGAE
jgi:hypothetical protein